MNPIHLKYRKVMPQVLYRLFSKPKKLWGCAGLIGFSNYAHSAVEASTFSLALISILLIVCAIQVVVIFLLKKDQRQSEQNQTELKTENQQLEQRFTDRSKKLISLNSKLYEEIAKHEITEELLRETQSYIQSMINSMPSILIGVTRNGIITHWNDAAQEATKIHYNNALGKHLDEIAPELGVNTELIQRTINSEKPQKRESRPHGHGSTTNYSDLTIYPLVSSEIEGAVIRIDDVTMRVQLETMMIQNEKMNSLGELAAGVAHEINNPLGAILQNIQNIKRRISKDLPKNITVAKELDLQFDDIAKYLFIREIPKFIDEVKDAGERATLIVKNMLEFSRADSKKFNTVDIKELLNRSVELSLSTIHANKSNTDHRVKINTDFPKDNISVNCSASELQQVILNLISNAYQAFSDFVKNKDEDRKEYDDKDHNKILEIDILLSFTDTKMKIEIRDNGPGMNKWTQRHIFDPFFTTKEVGEGTGLGLSVSYFIITEHHQGSISVNSEINKGSTFTIEIPLDLN